MKISIICRYNYIEIVVHKRVKQGERQSRVFQCNGLRKGSLTFLVYAGIFIRDNAFSQPLL